MLEQGSAPSILHVSRLLLLNLPPLRWSSGRKSNAWICKPLSVQTGIKTASRKTADVPHKSKAEHKNHPVVLSNKYRCNTHITGQD